ncbi:MAG TPA: GNAT family N-acetyltransferase [Verrucomicrobiae bacterium]
MPEISLASTDAELARCYPVMAQLRPHVPEREFISRVRRQAANGNYALAYAHDAGHVKSVAGFRLTESLFYGPFLYVDDLVTDQAARSKGHGDALFDWLVDYARKNGCLALALDSGVQRFAAHRFYLRKRMDILCHHFALKL